MTAPMKRASEVVRVERVEDAGDAAALFRAKFGHALPDFPAHYLATYKSQAVGYVHMTSVDEMRLCGGLCVDERAYRRMSGDEISRLRAAGGIARMMVAVATADREGASASFGYMGNRQSQIIAEQVGYELVLAPHIYAYWHEASGDTRTRLLEKVAKLGPF
jgi:hypothetical protein